MKDIILIFLLALLLCAWINLIVKRKKEKRRLQKEIKELLEERINNKIIPVRRDAQQALKKKKSVYFPKEITGSRNNIYPYLRKDRRNGKERRTSRVPVGITFEFIDRRQADHTKYTGPERRSGADRRGKIWDRRKPVAFQYT
ncbi:MAG: hypothetical protein PVJ50_07895 [Desulfobacterales bacterium]|jgi:hypothetical protein